jgi:hypothetical protein
MQAPTEDGIGRVREEKGKLVRLVRSLDRQHAQTTEWQIVAWRSLLARIKTYAREERSGQGSVASSTQSLLNHAELRLQQLAKAGSKARSSTRSIVNGTKNA